MMTHVLRFLRLAFAPAVMIVATLSVAAPALAQIGTMEARPSDLLPQAPQNAAEFALQKEDVRASIELWESRVRGKIQHIDRILKDFDLQQIQHQEVAVPTLVEILNDLEEEALAIIRAHNQIGPDLKLYREALLKAPALFERIATNLDSQAAAKKSTFLKEAYADFAAESRNLASAYRRKAGGIDGLEADIAKKMQFVHESREFISDVRQFLEAIPIVPGSTTEKLISRINQYIEVFQEAISAIKGVTHKIGEGPQPSTPSVKPAKASARTRAQNAPTTLEEYRKRLTALRR